MIARPYTARQNPPKMKGALIGLCWVDPVTDARRIEHLRVLIANERKDRLALVAPIVMALGHEVIAREIEVEDVAAVAW